MRDIPSGVWIGLGIFLAVMVIGIEVQLYVIRGLLQELRDHFISANDSDDDSV